MSKKTLKNPKSKNIVEMQLVNPNAAGIDVGDTLHAVAVPDGRDTERVKTFGSMTCCLLAIVSWLKQCSIETVAMESTGVYWKPLFELLIQNGFEVYLVNAKQVRNVTGRKNDEDDAMWIQKLHSCGLLKSSFLPDDEQETLRTLVRYRKTLVQDCIQGNWREEHLFTLAESYQFYKFYKERIASCDKQIEIQLQHYEASRNEGVIETATVKEEAEKASVKKPAKTKKKKDKNHPRFDVRGYLERIHGVDVLAIYGLSETGGLDILAETGTDLSKWPSEGHYKSWLNLACNNKISGGKLISSHLMKKKPNLASQAFRNAANAVQKSEHWIGDYFRRMKTKGGNKYAVIATAGKIATIYYKMVRYKQEFNPIDLEQYQQKYKQAKIKYLERKLNELKIQVA